MGRALANSFTGCPCRGLTAPGNLPNLDATEFEVFLANVGKELTCSKMCEEERKLYQAAALEQWEKEVQNPAPTPFTMEQSSSVRSEIKAGAKHTLPTPRFFVLTDKMLLCEPPGVICQSRMCV